MYEIATWDINTKQVIIIGCKDREEASKIYHEIKKRVPQMSNCKFYDKYLFMINRIDHKMLKVNNPPFSVIDPLKQL